MNKGTKFRCLAALVLVVVVLTGCGGGSGSSGKGIPADPVSPALRIEGPTGASHAGGVTAATDFPCERWIHSLRYVQAGNEVTLMWELVHPACEIVIYRGSVVLDTIEGSVTSYTLTESSAGLYLYTVALFDGGDRLDDDSVLVDLCKVVWDAPGCPYTGFFIYVAEAIGDPYTALPYDDPMDYSFDACRTCEVPLKRLYDEGLLEGGKTYYLAASSYLGDPVTQVSELTDPLTFTYEVALPEK